MLVSQAGAIGFSYAHTLLDWIVGLFGTDRAALSTMSGALLAVISALYALWAVALALRHDRGWMSVLLILPLVWAFLVSGTSITFCLPPCPEFAPFGDIVHLGSLAFGAWASVVAWRHMRSSGGSFPSIPGVGTIALLAVASVLSSALAAEYLDSLPR